jgi:6-phospho-3-hexuloisomerase
VGLASTAFAMRLAHLGLNAFMLGDSNVSAISKGDLLLVSSGSGETQTIYDLVCIAKIHGARVALVTGNPLSRMGLLADVIVNLKSPSKINNTNDFKSRQPMTTLNEQCLWLFFDAVVLELMEKMKIKDEDMKKRHSILE